jgi:putative peptide zinc metalloprotease protein
VAEPSARLDTSELASSYVLRSGNGRYVKLSASAHYLLTRIDGGTPAEELAAELSGQLGRTVTADQVRAGYEQVRRQIAAIEGRTGRARTFGLWFRVRCMPAPMLAWVTRRLAAAFHPLVAVPLGLACLVAVVLVAGDWSGMRTAMADSGPLFLPIFGLFVLSMLAHEIGHASACARYGLTVRDIGVGLYLIFPVFYSDVSAAWELTRRRRIVVDVAGTYFQLMVGTAYLLIYELSGWEVFRLGYVVVFYLSVFVLIPVFKFDGYWLLADLLGVVNLHRQVPRVAAHLRDRLRRRPGPELPWPPRVTAAVTIYGAVCAVVVAFFLVRLGSVFGGLVVSYPARIGGLVRDLAQPPHTLAAGRLHTVLGPTYVLLGVGFGLINLAVRASRAVRGRKPKQ